jgi:hypothetical protein
LQSDAFRMWLVHGTIGRPHRSKMCKAISLDVASLGRSALTVGAT